MNKPNLLFITPTVPNPTHNGLSMRAFSFIKTLSSNYRIFLLAGNQGSLKKPLPLNPAVLKLCHGFAHVPLDPKKDMQLLVQKLLYKLSPWLFYHLFSMPSDWLPITGRINSFLSSVYPEIHFETIHVFRLYMFPIAQYFLKNNRCNIIQLDLDDIESITKRRLQKIYKLNGNYKMAKLMSYEADSYELKEKKTLVNLDRIFVCSKIDKEKVYRKYHCTDVEVVPNVINVIPKIPEKSRSTFFTFLFVGTLGYYPNFDGILFFCKQILPLIRQKATQDFLVNVIGYGKTRNLIRELSHVPEVNVIGHVPDVAPYYIASDSVIVPIRAGGGTRIKVLEAFSYKRPVISTNIGVEGLDVQEGVHLLIGDSKEAFAQNCIHIMNEYKLRKKLTQNAFNLILNNYSLSTLNKVLIKKR